MKIQRFLLGLFVAMLLLSGNVSAQTCYDPQYGYYDCNEDYYYPDQGQAFMEGAFLGMVLGGFAGEGDEHEHWHGGHEHGGGHHGGGGGHHH